MHKGMFDGTQNPKLMVVCFQLASKELALYVGKYEEGVGVLLYDGPREGDDKFTINKDGTISPLKAPNLVIGMIAKAFQHDRSAYE